MIFLLSILGWALVGAIVGYVASRMVNLHGDDPILGIGLAALAAVVGGWLYNWISGSPVVIFNAWTLLSGAVAAVVAVVILHAIRSRMPHERPSIRRSY
jgi:uncharacterized membrane protein YeaQ/YmgE (transglycosylase-associated protein family)